MSEREWPLHVKVAAALGAESIRYTEEPCHVGQTVCIRCSGLNGGNFPSFNNEPKMIGTWEQEYWVEDEDVGEPVPYYDCSWAALGPEIVRLGISLAPDQTLPGTWGAWVGDFAPLSARDESPLVAVCVLILEMQAAGRKVAE